MTFNFSFGLDDIFDPKEDLTWEDKEALLALRDRQVEDYLSGVGGGSIGGWKRYIPLWTCTGGTPTSQPVDSTINQGGMYPSTSTSAAFYSGPYGGSAGSITGPYGNSVGYATGPNGNTVIGDSGYDYSNSLPPGIPRNMIPPGQEDLYILKSEVVPPVCPACPTSAACPREEKCPPCPACARCPEPSFECKKVPNYNAINNTYLPVPVLNDFSTFGM